MNQDTKKPGRLPDANSDPGAAGDARGMVMVFNVITGKGKEESKRTFRLHKGRVVIGSALSSDIRIQQNSVSNVHAVIELTDQGVPHIYDMASETGVFVNDKKAVSQDLKPGDEIKIGFALLTFNFQPLEQAQAAIPSESVRSSGARQLFLNEKEDFRPLILEDERNVIDIFDYPRSGEQALQVAVYWDDVILDIRHYVDEKEIVLGEDKKADFLVPGVLSGLPLASRQGNEWSVRITDDMEGIIRSRQRVVPLDDIRKEKGASSFTLTLRGDDLVKVKIKGITLFLSFTPVPPVLRRQRMLERDPLYLRIWFASLGLTLATMIAMVQMDAPKELTVDELPPRVATIIFRPIEPPPVQPRPPKEVMKVEPKPLPKKLPDEVKKPQKLAEKAAPVDAPKPVKQAENPKPKAQPAPQKPQPPKVAGGNQGEGAKAKGTEGRKGSPTAKPGPVPAEKSRGSPNAGAQKSQTQGKGTVESLTGDLAGSISKTLAAGSKGADAAAGRMRGYGGFTTQGDGGLGSVGTGKGGGGTSLDVAGLGTKGLGEGASGKGLGALGEGGNILGSGRGRPVVEVGNSQETVIVGGLDKSVIDEYIRRHMNQIRYCYEREANASKQVMRGRVAMRFVISASGRVSQSGVEATSLGNANVERCLVGVIQRIVFPEPLGGGIVEVSYPFLFSPAVANQ